MKAAFLGWGSTCKRDLKRSSVVTSAVRDREAKFRKSAQLIPDGFRNGFQISPCHSGYQVVMLVNVAEDGKIKLVLL